MHLPRQGYKGVTHDHKRKDYARGLARRRLARREKPRRSRRKGSAGSCPCPMWRGEIHLPRTGRKALHQHHHRAWRGLRSGRVHLGQQDRRPREREYIDYVDLYTSWILQCRQYN